MTLRFFFCTKKISRRRYMSRSTDIDLQTRCKTQKSKGDPRLQGLEKDYFFPTRLMVLSKDFEPLASPNTCHIIIPEAFSFASEVFFSMVGCPL